MRFYHIAFSRLACAALLSLFGCGTVSADNRPNIVLLMADDMGWGETGYYGHPVLRTPQLDAMAANGLRLDRFYAGAPVCSPTRASVMTGRVNERCGVVEQGYALRLQEKTLAQALKAAGYATGHFGKWHLDGLRGPGVPILADDPHGPGRFGFDRWLSTSNFFDLDPLLSREGNIEAFSGDSSDIIAHEALRFIEQEHAANRPFLAVIWYASPHKPFLALPEDKLPFAALDEESASHYGEMVGLDRSVGTVRRRLRELGIAENTLVIFCSDNGGLPGVTPSTVGGLRGFKQSLYEGGLRVPAIVEWPGVVVPGRKSEFLAATMDIFPTIVDLLDLPRDSMIEPIDGISLRPLLEGETLHRKQPIPFRFLDRLALIDQRFKLLLGEEGEGSSALYDLTTDPAESTDVSDKYPEVAQRMRRHLLAWSATVDRSIAGADYPERRVSPPDPAPEIWSRVPAYQPYLESWSKRREYQRFLRSTTNKPDRD